MFANRTARLHAFDTGLSRSATLSTSDKPTKVLFTVIADDAAPLRSNEVPAEFFIVFNIKLAVKVFTEIDPERPVVVVAKAVTIDTLLSCFKSRAV